MMDSSLHIRIFAQEKSHLQRKMFTKVGKKVTEGTRELGYYQGIFDVAFRNFFFSKLLEIIPSLGKQKMFQKHFRYIIPGEFLPESRIEITLYGREAIDQNEVRYGNT